MMDVILTSFVSIKYGVVNNNNNNSRISIPPSVVTSEAVKASRNEHRAVIRFFVGKNTLQMAFITTPVQSGLGPQ